MNDGERSCEGTPVLLCPYEAHGTNLKRYGRMATSMYLHSSRNLDLTTSKKSGAVFLGTLASVSLGRYGVVCTGRWLEQWQGSV